MSSLNENIEFYVEGVLLLLVATIGILGNATFIAISCWSRQKLNTFHRYCSIFYRFLTFSFISSLSFFDLIYLISSIFIFAFPLFLPELTTSFIFTYTMTILLPLAHIGLIAEILQHQKNHTQKSTQRGIRQFLHMYICLYCTLQPPEVALTFF